MIAHDSIAFATLVREHGPRMLAVATRYLPHSADAEDAVQEAFVSVVRSISSFQRASSIETWLHRIEVNCALMNLRRRRRKPELTLEDAALEAGATPPRGRTPAPSAHAALERDEQAGMVRASVAQLPAAQRAVLLLRDVQLLGLKAIAVLLDIKLSAVKFRLRGARQTLALTLGPSTQGLRPTVPLLAL